MNEKLKNNIIEILKSEEAKKYFKDILHDQTDSIVNEIQIQFKNTENDDLQNIKMILDEEISRNKKLKQELADITSDIEDNKKEIQDVLKKNAKLVLKLEEKEKYIHQIEHDYTNSLNKEKQQIKKVMEDFHAIETKYELIENTYALYNNLPDNIKMRMSNIFKKNNIYNFIVALSDWNNIEGIWGFIKRRIIEDECEALTDLIKLFLLGFSIYTLAEEKEKYILIQPKEGERYNSDEQSIKGIKPDGIIERVLLDGVFDLNSNKVLLKAVVELR